MNLPDPSSESNPAPVFPAYFPAASDLRASDPLPGIHMLLGWTEKLMVSQVTIEPGAEIPEHDHPHDQAGVCLEGTFELTIGGQTRVMEPGDIYLIPGGVPHSVRGLEGRARTVDLFAPPREDYQ